MCVNLLTRGKHLPPGPLEFSRGRHQEKWQLSELGKVKYGNNHTGNKQKYLTTASDTFFLGSGSQVQKPSDKHLSVLG